MFQTIDWRGILVPELSLLEMVVRATIMYFVLVLLMRVISKRQVGGVGTTDILVVVLLAEVAGNGFTAGYKSVVEGTVLVSTVLLWSYILEWLAKRFPAFERFLYAPTVLLIENGKMLRKNMRSELVTDEELLSQLRLHGIDDCAKVKRACIELDGKISVIQMDT